MERKDKDLKPYANFLFEVGALARTPRAGFRHLGDWRQSVAEHLCRTAYIGFTLAHLEQERGTQVDVARVVEGCLFHDLGEARASDLDYISQKYTKTDEPRAIEDSVRNLSFGPRIVNAFREVEERLTPEGIVAEDADQLELLISLKEIMDTGNKLAESWIPPLLKRLRTASAQELAEEILRTDSNNWWFENRDDNYWVIGGKDCPDQTT